MTRRGKSNITVRIDEGLWADLGSVVTDRSALIRSFIAWYVRRPDAKMPRRPESVTQKDDGDHGAGRPHSSA